jgi:pseudouridine-5'-phosphate glycosidase
MLDVRPEVMEALRHGRPVVALESTLIAHGLPWPVNRETAHAAEEAVRAVGAVPATIAVLRGRPTVGLDAAEIEALAESVREPGGTPVRKASRRDLAAAVAAGATAATTVAATLWLAHRAGIRVFATGGIGGVHPVSPHEPGSAFDVSADLTELARTPVAVVCAGAKSILDLAATLEVLETNGVPVVGYGTDEFPAFYLTSSGLPVSARVDTPGQAAALLQAHWELGGAGVVLAQPLPAGDALEPAVFAPALAAAERDAVRQGVRGPARTPFLLARLAELTGGRTLRANQALIVANAHRAAEVARALGQG